ncbi:MAG: hypothetical protein H6711_34105 [Myxococcales bacterium]|nr:hypothetical protein [Myxococcales bacterium]
MADIQLGGWSLGEIHASLLNSAEGRVSGSAFNIPARKVQLEAGFRVAGDEAGELLGETVTVGLSADGELAGSIADGDLRLGELVVTSWPLEIRLVELQGACK